MSASVQDPRLAEIVAGWHDLSPIQKVKFRRFVALLTLVTEGETTIHERLSTAKNLDESLAILEAYTRRH